MSCNRDSLHRFDRRTQTIGRCPRMSSFSTSRPKEKTPRLVTASINCRLFTFPVSLRSWYLNDRTRTVSSVMCGLDLMLARWRSSFSKLVTSPYLSTRRFMMANYELSRWRAKSKPRFVGDSVPACILYSGLMAFSLVPIRSTGGVCSMFTVVRYLL